MKSRKNYGHLLDELHNAHADFVLKHGLGAAEFLGLLEIEKVTGISRAVAQADAIQAAAKIKRCSDEPL